MTNLAFAMLLLSICSNAQSARKISPQSDKYLGVDTLRKLDLKSILNCNCSILHLKNPEAASRDRIQVLQNNMIVADMLLPFSDEEVKNLTIDKIAETNRGFKIIANWGGGRYFYGRSFYFEYKKGIFYLVKIERRSYVLESNRASSDKIKVKPPAKIDSFILFQYIANE